MKKCSKCKVQKELKEYNKNARSKDGYNGVCRTCRSIQVKKSADKNKDHKRAYQKLYSQRPEVKEKRRAIEQTAEYKEKKKSYLKEYNQRPEIKEKMRLKSKADYKKRKDYFKEYNKKYYKNNKEYFFIATSKYRSKKGDVDLTKEEYIKIMETTNWKCSYCNATLTRKNKTLDHVVPVSKGGSTTINNLVPCCSSCNSSKQDKMIYEFIPYILPLLIYS